MKTARKNGRRAVAHCYRHPLLGAINSFLNCLHQRPDAAARRSVRWTPQAAATAAVLLTFTGGCTLAAGTADVLAAMAADFAGRRQPGQTYNGLVKALERQNPDVLVCVKSDLRRQTRPILDLIPKTRGWILLAVDGSKIDLPRTQDHERYFGVADNGHVPQAFLTAVMEVHTGLLWDWRIDRADASEKHHLQAMTAGLPPRSLLLADGNFVGYPIWSALAGAGRSFLIRIGGNVHLLTGLWPQARIERRGDIVYVWPKIRRSACPPLRLRLIRIGSKKNPVYLLTNILDARRLSRQAAGKIYRRRWGAEIFYRTFKRTLGQMKLRSRAARRARLELEWKLIGSCILALLGIECIRRAKGDPRRMSPVGVYQAVRTALLRGLGRPGAPSLRQLRRTLAGALRDRYQRHGSKTSRYRGKTRNTPRSLRLKPPKIRWATAEERALAHQKYPDLAT